MKLSSQACPKVSIIIPTKNRCVLLRQTIASVRQQTYHRWETIVVDDGSTDRTIEEMTALSHEDPRVRFFQRSGDRSGAPVCRNQGVAQATGDYIVFLDSDDCLAPFCLEQRVNLMQSHPSLDFAVFPCQLFRNQPGDLALLWNADTPENDLDRFLHLHDVPWQTTGPIWRREALEHLGVWDEELLRWQDWEFHVRSLIKGMKYKKFAAPDCFWRVSSQNRKTVGTTWTPEHIFCLEKLLLKVHTMLLQAQMLDESRQSLLAGLYFWVANRWIDRTHNQEAIRVWSVCREKLLISSLEYQEGLLYFKTQNILPIKRVIRKYLNIRWTKSLLAQKSNTFQNTPFPVETLAMQIS